MTSITGPDETEFARLLNDWKSTCASAPSDIEGWSRALQAIAQEEHDLRERGAWVHGRDDFFGVVGIHRAEVKHSAMIAWLLDPCARHGLGTRFLAGVLRRSFPTDEFRNLVGARPECEVTRGDCRADIVIWMSDATIVVENKVDANEGRQQCDTLFERFGADVGARFILLTPSGKRPESATGDAAEAFASMSYGDVRAILADALATASAGQSPWGRRAAEDYLRTLQKEFR